jgi:hypothetical protein
MQVEREEEYDEEEGCAKGKRSRIQNYRKCYSTKISFFLLSNIVCLYNLIFVFEYYYYNYYHLVLE